MSRSMRFILTTICCLSATVLFGCQTIKETGKGFLGVSTKVLETKRKDALKKSFALDYGNCYKKVKDLLKVKDIQMVNDAQIENESYIYADDLNKKMIALYLSQADTVPVGIFFTVEGENKTLIEVSSPSTYAKEFIAKKIFTGLDALINPKVKENKTNVKEEVSN